MSAADPSHSGLPPGPPGGTEGAASRGDRLWASEDPERAAARSRQRADLALALLARAGVRGGRLLDVGCGPGWALERFREAGFDAEGVEASPDALALALSRRIPARALDIESEDLPAGFDAVAALEVLEHVRDPIGILGKMTRSLAPGGRLVVSLPNEFHLLRRLAILAGRPGAAGHRDFGGHDDPHLRWFTPRSAERLFAAAGLDVLDRAAAGLAPPRLAALRRISSALAALRPSLFAIAGVWLLAPRAAGGEPAGPGGVR